MKRIIALLLAFIMCTSLCACGTEMNDAGFISNLTSALEARWKLASASTTTANETAYKEELTKFVDAELSKLGNYSEYTFTDKNLASLAEQYYAALESQREAIQYYSVDNALYQQLFTANGYNKRAEIIYLINNDYSLQVNSKYTSTMNDFLALGEKIHAIENLLTQELILESTGNEYEIIIENSSKYDLSNAQLNFNFYDDAGCLVNTSSTYLTSWPAGNKTRATVYTADTKFSTAEMNISSFSDSIETKYAPVELVNNMIIEIEPPELPQELSYGYSGRVYSSAIINAFEYETSYWNEGKACVILSFSGTKTFDKGGESASDNTSFRYKLYDDDNVVVSSGSVYVDPLTVGESFKGASTYTSELSPGTYRLVIEDYMS